MTVPAADCWVSVGESRLTPTVAVSGAFREIVLALNSTTPSETSVPDRVSAAKGTPETPTRTEEPMSEGFAPADWNSTTSAALPRSSEKSTEGTRNRVGTKVGVTSSETNSARPLPAPPASSCTREELPPAGSAKLTSPTLAGSSKVSSSTLT